MGAMQNNETKIILKAAIFLIALIGGFFGGADLIAVDSAVAAKTDDIAAAPGNFSKLAEMVSPAVVNIRTVKTIKGGGPVFRQFQRDPWGRESPFKDFFEKF